MLILFLIAAENCSKISKNDDAEFLEKVVAIFPHEYFPTKVIAQKTISHQDVLRL